MNIGVNAAFSRKPGTGIGQVTVNFLWKLMECQHSNSKCQGAEFFLYFEEEPRFTFSFPENFHIRVVRPWWGRDDLIRRILWERWQLPKAARTDGCEAFWSLYQSPTRFHDSRTRVRHIMLVHDVIPRLFPEYVENLRKRLYWKMTEKGIMHVDRIVAVSETTKRDIISELGIPAEHIVVAYPGLSSVFEKTPSDEVIGSVLEKYGLEKDAYLYYGGGLEIRKNTEALLKAYAVLKKNHKNSSIPPLVISGKIFPEFNPLATPVERLIREFRLGDHVKLLGFVPEEDLPALYRGAILFVYPSRYEGFGLPVLEAMKCGTPVLAARTSSLPEVGGDAIEYFNLDVEGGLEGKMIKLIAESDRRKELSRKGRERAESFSYDMLVDAFICG